MPPPLIWYLSRVSLATVATFPTCPPLALLTLRIVQNLSSTVEQSNPTKTSSSLKFTMYSSGLHYSFSPSALLSRRRLCCNPLDCFLPWIGPYNVSLLVTAARTSEFPSYQTARMITECVEGCRSFKNALPASLATRSQDKAQLKAWA